MGLRGPTPGVVDVAERKGCKPANDRGRTLTERRTAWVPGVDIVDEPQACRRILVKEFHHGQKLMEFLSKWVGASPRSVGPIKVIRRGVSTGNESRRLHESESVAGDSGA